MNVDFGKTAEAIELPFGMVDVGLIKLCIACTWTCILVPYVANRPTVERLFAAAMSGSAIRDGDAACSQIT